MSSSTSLKAFSLQKISIEPKVVTMFCEEQLILANKIVTSSVPVWHIDATGSLIKKCNSEVIYLYAIVIPVKVFGEPCLPIIEWLSSSHDTSTISSILLAWWTKVRSLLVSPAVIVVDGSWTLMHSIALVFNAMPLERLLAAQWCLWRGDSRAPTVICLRLCAAHYLKSISRRLAKMRVSNEVGGICVMKRHKIKCFSHV